MTSLSSRYNHNQENPLDLIEKLVSANDWPFERNSSNEINVSIEGSWTRYHLWFAWIYEREALQFSCAFDFRVPDEKIQSTHSLLAEINEKLWLGHFDLWADVGMLMFRHSQLFAGGMGATLEQINTLVDTSIEECERIYPAVHFMLWGGKSPKDAIAAAMLETKGKA